MKREKMTPKELVKELKKGATMILDDEETRLNRIGAEIMGYKAKGRVWTTNNGPVYAISQDINQSPYFPVWSPATDLNHTAMVGQELIKIGWRFDIILEKCCAVEGTKYISFSVGRLKAYGAADTEPLARARAYEKVWKAEKGE